MQHFAKTGIVFLGLILVTLHAETAAPSESHYHTHMCDASAGAILNDNLFVVANDEDNVLRIFRSEESGAPVAVADLSTFLAVDQDHPETDIEGAAWLGERLYWITSHGRNKDGKKRGSRYRFFATRIIRSSGGVGIVPVLKPYEGLLEDLLKERHLNSLDLSEASRRAPKDEGGFNIEALCSTPEGHLLIGFRNPIPRGRALIIPFLNPAGVLIGQSAQFGEPIFLSLGGYGVRDMAWTGHDYLIIAGSYDSEGVSRLFRWNGRSETPEEIRDAHFHDFNPEALLLDPKQPGHVLVLSDDGTLQVQGADCKTLTDPQQKRFRSQWLDLANHP